MKTAMMKTMVIDPQVVVEGEVQEVNEEGAKEIEVVVPVDVEGAKEVEVAVPVDGEGAKEVEVAGVQEPEAVRLHVVRAARKPGM